MMLAAWIKCQLTAMFNESSPRIDECCTMQVKQGGDAARHGEVRRPESRASWVLEDLPDSNV